MNVHASKSWLLGLVWVFAGWAVASWWLSPPRALGLDAPSDRFSGMRAWAALERVLGDQAPHPVGTPANRAVEARIQSELAELGLSAEVDEQVICAAHCARIRNLLVRLPGQGTPVLVSTHYDSVNSGPGAGDAGAAVGTMLELTRLLQVRPATRPVHLLFNEGEEAGLLGAQAYLRTPRDVGAVINLEARGTGGNAFLFELKGAPLPWMQAYSRHARSPSVSSLYTAIYDMLPNNTDATVYGEHGLPVANVAFLGGGVRYHTPADDLAHLDPGSLQHLGDQAVALLEGLDEADLAPLHDDEPAVFWDVLGLFVVRVPALPFQIAVTLLALLHLRRAKAAILPALAGVAFVVCAAGLGGLAEALRGAGAEWLGVPALPLLALTALVLALALNLNSGWDPERDLRDGPGLLLAVLTVLTAWVLPEGSYLFAQGMVLLTPLPRRFAVTWPLRAFLASLPLFHISVGLVPALGLFGPLVTGGLALAIVPLLPLFRPVPRPVRLGAPLLAVGLLLCTFALPQATPDRPTGMLAIHLSQDGQGWLNLTPTRFPYANALEVESVTTPFKLGRHVLAVPPSTRAPARLVPLGPGRFRVRSKGAIGLYIAHTTATVDGVSAQPFHWLGDPDGLEIEVESDGWIATIYPGADVGELPPNTVPIHSGWQTWVAEDFIAPTEPERGARRR